MSKPLAITTAAAFLVALLVFPLTLWLRADPPLVDDIRCTVKTEDLSTLYGTLIDAEEANFAEDGSWALIDEIGGGECSFRVHHRVFSILLGEEP